MPSNRDASAVVLRAAAAHRIKYPDAPDGRSGSRTVSQRPLNLDVRRCLNSGISLDLLETMIDTGLPVRVITMAADSGVSAAELRDLAATSANPGAVEASLRFLASMSG